MDPPGPLERAIVPATHGQQLVLAHIDAHGDADGLFAVKQLPHFNVIDTRPTVCSSSHGDDLLEGGQATSCCLLYRLSRHPLFLSSIANYGRPAGTFLLPDVKVLSNGNYLVASPY